METPCVAVLNKNVILFFTKTENRRAEQVLSWVLVLVRGGRMWKKECRRVNIVQILYTHECQWKKMIPVEAIPGMGEREIKENGRGGEFKYDIL
jgi:hypothetical protein